MRPKYRDLNNTQSSFLSQKQNLRIESKAFRALLLEYRATLLQTKSFESALSIHEWQTNGPAHDEVEYNARRFSNPRLTDLDQSAVQRARTDRSVISTIAQRGKQ